MSFSIEKNESKNQNKHYAELVEEAIRQSNERRHRRKKYEAYLTSALPNLIQQSPAKRFFRQFHHNQHLIALDIKPKDNDNHTINKFSSVTNTSCGLAYLALHIDEIVRNHAHKLAPVSAALALAWNAVSIIANIAIIRLLFKQKLYAEAAALSGATGLLGSSTVGSFLTLHSIHVIQGVAVSAVGVFGYFAFAACAGVALGVELGHIYGAQKRKQFYENELAVKEKELTDENNTNKIDELEIHTVALKNLINQEASFIQEHKKRAIAYGVATAALTALSVTGLLISIGVITGVVASVASVGAVPAALAIISVSVTLWSYFHRVDKTKTIDPINDSKKNNGPSAIAHESPSKIAGNTASLFSSCNKISANNKIPTQDTAPHSIVFA